MAITGHILGASSNGHFPMGMGQSLLLVKLMNPIMSLQFGDAWLMICLFTTVYSTMFGGMTS